MKEKINRFLTDLSEKITYRHWVFLAGAASLILGLLVFAGLNGMGANEEVKPVDSIHVVVAKQDIAPKTIIKESMVEVREVPASMVSDDAVREVSDIVNKPAKVEILKDDIISTRKVLMDITMAGFTGDIPPECRAISIAITDVTGVAGFAKPGDYVDVMLIAKGDEKMTGRIVLQDVLLLAINKNTEQKQKAAGDGSSGDTKKTGDSADSNNQSDKKSADAAKDEAISDLATATLALLPEDALKLITEAQEGTLYLALRPYKPRDKFTTDTRYIHYSTTKTAKSSGTRTATPAPAAPAAVRQAVQQSIPVSTPAPKAPVGGVEVIRGTTSTREGA
ncbi:Flp pilus assembly protein CpaB [Anaerovibrio lipolyticus]|uniref:Flp pilus assembly protein CpaB n=1 Tax=Anaerovibrio lipolyticus TaxID=82374 RepID=UPI001F1D5C48|nr:Flp pilus assembly protein CpaB [Anaerovibrio lipolyticus]MCF2601479.1 Flp pilus assembly protein CpaB [Anaerovibrio lipolyticus]